MVRQEPGSQSPNRLQEKNEIKNGCPVEDVLKIVPGFFFRRMLLAQSVHLRQTRHARRHLQPLLLPIGVASDALRRFRPRAYEAHLATQNIEKLGQFRNAQPAEQFMKFGCTFVFRFDIETIHSKRPAVPATADFRAKEAALS